ncbi:FAD/NAD(P)-binding protein [Ancylobacter sp. Lp-2]|uniref:FAD/NAD(P)-binding protein n=1 Tax=Ancylobacter sp. Lp-2 TaxID=2881339 RepID=UPI0021050A9F|nr:FAD/NAD(P)-binding protein [Ancylobacter sp. Lp-2]MCB4771229.1 FAD/NAD(P)-binding protein [Ancylobacter sp. Lp-2]
MTSLTSSGDRSRRAVIVGGGANGTWMGVHLARVPGIEEIVLIDRDGRFGRGVAYSATADCHRLNVPAERMGGRDQEDGAGFATWLQRNGWPAGRTYEDTFVPRRLYGDYLCAELAAVEATRRLSRLRDDVQALERRPGGHAVVTASGKTIEAATVVLCLGNPPPAPIRATVPAPRLVPDIWAAGSLDPIRASDDVVIVGTGATAIDAVLELVRRGVGSRIRMISRGGRLPLVDAPGLPCDPLDPIPADTVRGMMTALRAAISDHAERGIPWQSVFDAFRARAGDIWLALSNDERRRFLRHLRSPWLVHRHRLAPDIARQMEKLQAEGRVEIIAARVLGGEPTPEGYALRLHRRGRPMEAGETLETDWVINCTGPDEHYSRSRIPLVQSLLSCGVARPGPFGLGLDCDHRHRLVDADGQAHAGLYLVGPPGRGRFWEVTSVPNGRDQCVNVAKDVAATLVPVASQTT